MEKNERFAGLELDDMIVPLPTEPSPLGEAQQAFDAEAARLQRERETTERMRAQRMNGQPLRAPYAPREIVRPEVVQPAATESKQIIAVDLPSEMTGAVVYWTLSGETNAQDLTDEWTARGLSADWLPRTVTADVALARAVKELADKDTIVRKHPEGGWALLNAFVTTHGAQNGEDKIGFEQGERFFLEGETVRSSQGHLAETSEFETVVAAFRKLRASLSTHDISTWLVGMMGAELGGVSLRDTGGIYFVPRDAIETLRKIKGALHTRTGHTVQEIPAMRSGEALGAIIEAVRREAADVVAAIESELTTEIGKRAVASRIASVEAIKAKVTGYEKLLNVTLGHIVQQLDATKAKLSAHTTRANQLEID